MSAAVLCKRQAIRFTVRNNAVQNNYLMLCCAICCVHMLLRVPDALRVDDGQGAVHGDGAGVDDGQRDAVLDAVHAQDGQVVLQPREHYSVQHLTHTAAFHKNVRVTPCMTPTRDAASSQRSPKPLAPPAHATAASCYSVLCIRGWLYPRFCTSSCGDFQAACCAVWGYVTGCLHSESVMTVTSGAERAASVHAFPASIFSTGCMCSLRMML